MNAKWTPAELQFLKTPSVRVNVVYTCGHEEAISQGMGQSDYSFGEGIKKRHTESCLDCKIKNEMFWQLVVHRVKELKRENLS